jgi:hypothetical protein
MKAPTAELSARESGAATLSWSSVEWHSPAVALSVDEFDRMVMRFSMIDGQTEIVCAISTSAMDNLESLGRSKPNEREAQFMRLSDRIEERTARKFLAMEFDGTPPGMILRSIDFET